MLQYIDIVSVFTITRLSLSTSPVLENGGPPVSISTPAIPPMTVSSHELAWADLDRYQLMTEREKKDTNMGDTNNDHGVWRVAGPPSITSQQKPMPVPGTCTLLILCLTPYAHNVQQSL